MVKELAMVRGALGTALRGANPTEGVVAPKFWKRLEYQFIRGYYYIAFTTQ